MITQASLLQNRTKDFAIRIVKLFRSLPKTDEARVLGKQVLRSGTSAALYVEPAQKLSSSPRLAS